ncbi:MAG TPA: redoxin family protein, partial [Kofleriaceae bacterium]|nr:redoxin family protein [Kofleriaceae bacterium]
EEAPTAVAADPAAGAPTQAPAEEPENPAPDFTLTDLDGNQHTLSSLRGRIVVLEWFNPGCPFVRYAHGEGPLRDLAARHTAGGVVWLAINSNAAGTQGHGADVNRAAAADWKMEHPLLLDADGAVGKAYGAKTTPHMYVIDSRGSLVYRGALDNAPLGKVPAEGYVNFVDQALAAVAEGRPVEVAETKPYGCTVKYAD